MLQEAISRIKDDIAIEANPSSESMLTRAQISAESTLAINESTVYNLERHESRVKLRIVGQVMTFEEPFSTAIEYLMESSACLVKDLPGLDPDQQLALCDHLVNANAITIGQ